MPREYSGVKVEHGTKGPRNFNNPSFPVIFWVIWAETAHLNIRQRSVHMHMACALVCIRALQSELRGAVGGTHVEEVYRRALAIFCYNRLGGIIGGNDIKT